MNKEKLEHNKWKFSEKTWNIAGIDKCINAMQRMIKSAVREDYDYHLTPDNREDSESWLHFFLRPLALRACRIVIIAANAFQNRHPDEFCQNYDPQDMPCEYKQPVIFETEGYEVIVQKKQKEPIRFK